MDARTLNLNAVAISSWACKCVRHVYSNLWVRPAPSHFAFSLSQTPFRMLPSLNQFNYLSVFAIFFVRRHVLSVGSGSLSMKYTKNTFFSRFYGTFKLGRSWNTMPASMLKWTWNILSSIPSSAVSFVLSTSWVTSHVHTSGAHFVFFGAELTHSVKAHTHTHAHAHKCWSLFCRSIFVLWFLPWSSVESVSNHFFIRFTRAHVSLFVYCFAKNISIIEFLFVLSSFSPDKITARL